VLTYKGQKLDTISKTREEFETEVNGENTCHILLALGFVASGNVSKKREIFKYDDITIVLDTVEGLGEFMEVEIVTESDNDAAKDKLFAFLNKLGIKQDDTIRTSYLEMVLGESAVSDSPEANKEYLKKLDNIRKAKFDNVDDFSERYG